MNHPSPSSSLDSALPATPSDSPRGNALTRAQWMVLIAAFLGWLFDGFEMGLFPIVARPALLDLIPGATDAQIGPWMARITACFLVGAAGGGLLFGWLGDRVGRVRALAVSVLTYSAFTGLAYFAQTPWQLGGLRFLAALGMGGEWSLGVALVMECWPKRWHPCLAGAIGASSNLGFLLTGVVGRLHPITTASWRWIFLVGVLPGLLVFFIRFWVPESARWQRSVRAGAVHPLREILARPMRGRILLGIALASVALIGTWGSVQWLPSWADQLAGAANPAAKADTQMTQAVGAILGSLLAPLLGAAISRRLGYALLCLLSVSSCAFVFRFIHGFGPAFLVSAFFVSAATASFYGWFPLYFPELFPTRIRATGQGVCYNFGRLFAAVGALTQGYLVASFSGSYARAGAIVTLVYLVGAVIVWFAPETKGRPLPD